MSEPTLGLARAVAIVAARQHSAPVAHWSLRILLTLFILAVLSGVNWLMWRGWKNRAARQVLVTWRLGDRVVDSGFHPRAKADRARLIDGLRALLTERTTT